MLKDNEKGIVVEESQLFLSFETLATTQEVADPSLDWKKNIPSVSQLTRSIRGHLENSFQDVWVKGEISNFKKPSSGHAYFILKDASAQIKVVFFKGNLARHKFELKDGMEILLHGNVTVYEARGEYQMVGDLAEPVGQGALQLAFQQLKEKLSKEGLFDPIHKKKLPFLPKRIGIVTSPTGAAVKDILKVLSRRFADRHILIFPAAVQGEKAPFEICQGIEQAERWNELYPDKKIDVLIVGRGGGSLEDLWCFNEEPVARAIFKCAIPIISAVGHEIDTTISDFVADLRAPTPSAAAEIVVPRKDDLIKTIDQYEARLKILLTRQLEQIKIHITHLTKRLVSPLEIVKKWKERFGFMDEKLRVAVRNRIELNRKQFHSMQLLLDSLSPLKILGRGYALVRGSNQEVIKSVRELHVGDQVHTLLSQGEFTSEVLSIKKD